MKKAVILKHGGGELANQLWNYASIYAYALEKGAETRNPSFFEYHPYFRFVERESALTKIFSFWFKDFAGRRSSLRNRFWRTVYAFYAKSIALALQSAVISSENVAGERTYLPPTAEAVLPQADTVYFLGWLFRNPKGLDKWRTELVAAFRPSDAVERRAQEIVGSLRKKGRRVFGIHLRQGDYKDFKGGRYLVTHARTREIIDEFARERSIDLSKASFVVTSDGKVDEAAFAGLDILISRENAVTDLFILSKTDAIIGSDSSFGAFASWYGDTPHIVMENGPMDWGYYRDKNSFFENRYATLARY